MISVRVRHLPPDSATVVALGGSGWRVEHFLLAHLFQAHTGEKHPALPDQRDIPDPQREKALAAARRRARERESAINAGEIT